MASKTIYEQRSRDRKLKPAILMFPNQIQYEESVVGVIELIYLRVFHPISSFMNLGTKEG